jgi:hypothetical protein
MLSLFWREEAKSQDSSSPSGSLGGGTEQTL